MSSCREVMTGEAGGSGRRIFVLVLLLKAFALVGIWQLVLTNLTTSIHLTQGRSDQPSEVTSMTLQGGNFVQFDLKNAAFLPRKILSQHRTQKSLPGDFMKHTRLLWEAKRRIGNQAATRHGIIQHIIWFPTSTLLSKSASSQTSLAGVVQLSTPRKLDQEVSSSINAGMNTKFKGYHPSPMTEMGDPMFHVDYSGPGTHPPHSH